MPGQLSKRLATMLKAIIEDRGLSQTEAGALIGQSQSQMSKYLRAERTLDVEELDALCRALGVDSVDLLAAAKRNPE